MKKISTDLHEMMNMIKCIYNENIEGKEFNMKKGFTLIELLAVIVILAIIALISTPMILGIIEKAKKGGAESSALGFIDAVEKTVATNMLDTNKTNIEDGIYEVNILKSTTYDVKVKGEQPTEDSWLKIEKGQVKECSLKIGEYVINCNGETTKNGEITTKPDGKIIKIGPTKVKATSTDTHKGIIYLDPTDLTKTCNGSNSISTTETKTGCMKWYIYSEDDSNYTMLLDHNTTALIKWNDDNKNVVYESSNLYAVVEDLKTTSGWKVNPRIISAEEINIVTGKTGFDQSNPSSLYYFDTLTYTSGTFSSTVRSRYDWLYNNSYQCKTGDKDYGCTMEDNNIYTAYGTTETGKIKGYWTQTIYTGSDNGIWRVEGAGGYLCMDLANAVRFGIRPVITIPKSIIS